jgi:hypothetical protein
MATYEMEQTFFPYISINFLPKRYNDVDKYAFIIVTKKNGTIRKDYDFTDVKKDTEDLKAFVWHYLIRDYDIKNIGIQNQNDFRQFNPNTVIQGWKNKKKELKDNECCKILVDGIVSNILQFKILHDVYKLDGKDLQTREICKKVRWGECGDNYPPKSALFKRCVDEVEWLCNHGYSPTNRVHKMDKLVEKTREEIYKYLVKHNMLVNKKKFDEIITAGLFDDLGNRMGNKVANDPNVRQCINDIFTEKDYFLRLVEDFEVGSNNSTSNFNWIWIIIILVFVLCLFYFLYKS